MTDEECMSAWALIMRDAEGKPTSFITCWKPSFEDLKALNAGSGIYVHFPYAQLPAMGMFTIDENGKSNDVL